MSQKSSLPQPAESVSRVLTADTLRENHQLAYELARQGIERAKVAIVALRQRLHAGNGKLQRAGVQVQLYRPRRQGAWCCHYTVSGNSNITGDKGNLPRSRRNRHSPVHSTGSSATVAPTTDECRKPCTQILGRQIYRSPN
jgi:hypothetical protein